VATGSVIIQACAQAGVDIPRFCYHDRLGIAGNCRMCLVSVEKMPKLIASCAQPVMPGMRIFTNTPAVQKGREGVMEFLLANHPLDCVVCDQGGECDLQDQSMHFGSDRSRLTEYDKRAVEDKDLGPLVKTSMNRCIHCTRCVRFANEIAGMDELGTTGRGANMEIGTYIEKVLDNPLSGNIIDLCPVGALTSKPYAFTARPWELKKTESIDVMDAVGSAIRIDSRDTVVMRILPRLNEEINEEWLSDKSRFSYDGLRNQRLLHPMVKNGTSFEKVEWIEALSTAASHLNSAQGKIALVTGDFVDLETLAITKQFLSLLGCKDFWVDEQIGEENLAFGNDYAIPGGIQGIEQKDAIVLVGTDPLKEATLLATRIRKAWVNNDAKIYWVGAQKPNSLPFETLNLNNLSELSNFKSPLILYGDYWKAKFGGLKSDIPNGQILRQAGRGGALELDIGTSPFSSKSLSEARVIFLLGADNDRLKNIHKLNENALIIYLGSHGDNGASMASIILAGAAFTEKDATFINLEGRVQRTQAAVPLPGNCRTDWKVIAALAEIAGKPLITSNQEIFKYIPSHLLCYGQIIPDRKETSLKTKFATLADYKDICSVVDDYYLTDVITRSSSTMAKCSQTFHKNYKNK
jgi:NADH dehydrogenase (ubiquinone) Fe-S protein 1